jgi:hypothetical protein
MTDERAFAALRRLVAEVDDLRRAHNLLFWDLETKMPAAGAEARAEQVATIARLAHERFVAAFEIEHTTAIYSGLLRMSDLVSMQPNLNIPLYLVAPDDRREKVFTEINRPTFSRMRTPLNSICQYLPYSELRAFVDRMGDYVSHLKPDFLDSLAEVCDPSA